MKKSLLVSQYDENRGIHIDPGDEREVRERGYGNWIEYLKRRRILEALNRPPRKKAQWKGEVRGRRH
jgi:hypothetical protein